VAIPKPGQTNLIQVALWMAGAVLSFCASAVAIRALAKNLNVSEILSIRSGLGVMILLALVAARPELRQAIVPRHIPLHLTRNVTHFIGQYAWALAVTLLPLATVFALEFTMPAWVAILAVVMLGERMTVSRAGSVVLGFIGVLIIVRPGMASFQPMAFVVLFAALVFALSLIATKKLTNHVSAFSVVFWMNVMQLPLALSWPVVTAIGGGPSLFVLRLGVADIVPMLALGIVGLTSHFCLSQAFRFGDASIVVPLDFLRLPLIALVGWVVYSEAIDIFVFAGAGLIICGVLWNLHSEMRRTAPAVATRTEEARSADA
jgi:drug/metabolite transporter (DMT)-like permease